MVATRWCSGLNIADGDRAPGTWSRGAQYRARKAQCQVRGTYGKLVESVPLAMDSGDDVHIAIQNPLEMLHYVAAHSTYFSDLLAATFDATQCSRAKPWSIVLYSSVSLTPRRRESKASFARSRERSLLTSHALHSTMPRH